MLESQTYIYYRITYQLTVPYSEAASHLKQKLNMFPTNKLFHSLNFKSVNTSLKKLSNLKKYILQSETKVGTILPT